MGCAGALFESLYSEALRPESAFWRVNLYKVARRDRAIVVIDGSFEMKAGFSCEDQPCVVVRTDVVRRSTHDSHFSITAPLAHFNIGSPQKVWAHAIATLLAALGVYPFAASVCIVFNPFYEMRPRLIKPVQVKQLHKVAAACLDSCQVHQVTFRWGPESVVHSFSKRRMGLVLEVGARFAFCVPVSTLRRHNNSSQSMPTTSSPVYTASNFTMAGIGLNHMAGNRSAAYSGEHLSTGRSERLSLMPTSPSGGLDLTALMQSMISEA